MASSNPEPITVLSPSCESPLPFSHAACRQDELFVPIRGGDIHCPCACHVDRLEEVDARTVWEAEKDLRFRARQDRQRWIENGDSAAFSKIYTEIEERGFLNQTLIYRAFFIDAGVPGFDGYVQLRDDVTDLLEQAEGD